MIADFQDWARSRQERIETSLQTLLPASNIPPERLHDAMRYTVLGGGKRVRPLLAFAAGELSNANDERVAVAAAAVAAIFGFEQLAVAYVQLQFRKVAAAATGFY